MKRKRYEKPNNNFKDKIPRLIPVNILKCDVCSDVIDFQQCIGTKIYCSYDCYAILWLSLKRSFLDEHVKNSVKEEDEMLFN